MFNCLIHVLRVISIHTQHHTNATTSPHTHALQQSAQSAQLTDLQLNRYESYQSLQAEQKTQTPMYELSLHSDSVESGKRKDWSNVRLTTSHMIPRQVSHTDTVNTPTVLSTSSVHHSPEISVSRQSGASRNRSILSSISNQPSRLHERTTSTPLSPTLDTNLPKPTSVNERTTSLPVFVPETAEEKLFHTNLKQTLARQLQIISPNNIQKSFSHSHIPLQPQTTQYRYALHCSDSSGTSNTNSSYANNKLKTQTPTRFTYT